MVLRHEHKLALLCVVKLTRLRKHWSGRFVSCYGGSIMAARGASHVGSRRKLHSYRQKIDCATDSDIKNIHRYGGDLHFWKS